MKNLFITIIVLFAFTLVSCSKDIELKNQDWSCEKGTCKVDFSLKSNKDHETIQKVRIIAHSQKDSGKGAVVDNIIGEKTVYIELKATEQKNCTETINLSSYLKPSMVVISHSESER